MALVFLFQELAKIPNSSAVVGELDVEALAALEREWESCHASDANLTFKQWTEHFNTKKEPKEGQRGAEAGHVAP